jgi:hypothetical protein
MRRARLARRTIFVRPFATTLGTLDRERLNTLF